MKYRNNFKLAFFLFLLFACRSNGQEESSKIDKKDLTVFIKTLSSSQFGGRGIDDDGQIKTQEFIIDRFRKLQLEPFTSDGYLEKFCLNKTSRSELFIITQNRRRIQNLNQMIFEGEIRNDGMIKREVVYGGRGAEEELNQIDVENRIVIILSKNLREDTSIRRSLAARNATGLIVIYEDEKDFESEKWRWRNFYSQKKYSIADRLPDATLISPELDVLTSSNLLTNTIIMSGTEAKNIIGLSKKNLINLANKKKNKNLPPAFINIHFEQVEKKVETANVIGIIKGESDKSIVISAHYDHVGIEDDFYYPGADDNASGVAALLELAEEFSQHKKLKYSLIFLATSAEEVGLLGSLYHTEQPTFVPEQVICNVNIDMISRCDYNHADCDYLYCIGGNKELDSIIRKADELFPFCAFDYSQNNSGIFERTDGYHFNVKGIPSLLFFAGFHDDYHKPTDTFDKIDFDILENRIRLIGEVIKLIQQE